MNGLRHRAADVLPLAETLLDRLRSRAERVEIAGSLRREAYDVKDVELLVMSPTAAFYDYTEQLVAGGHAEKAIYADGKQRWGLKYRGLTIQGIKIELFTADRDNWGYQYWLRTGPGNANKYLMSVRASGSGARFHFRDGYAWAHEQRLRLASEADFFALCGLPEIEPRRRSEKLYRQLFGEGHVWGDPATFVIAPAPPPPATSGEREDYETYWQKHGDDLTQWYENPDMSAPPPACWVERHGPWKDPTK